MATRAGVGFSENPKSRNAGEEAAHAAMAEAGVDECNLAIMYSTAKHDPTELRDGVRSVIGPRARLIGGYSIGTLTRDKLGYEGYQMGVAVISSDSMQVEMFIEKGLPDNEHDVGVALGEQIESGKYDGTPAADAIAGLLGDAYKSWEDYPFFVTLGLNKGDKFGEFKEEEYANRLVMGVDKERGGLIMFEPDLKAGDEVQLMRRSIDFGYIGERVEDLLERVGDRKPFLALYIDCAGRASAYSGTEREEAEEVQKAIGTKMPLLGMYSGVEIAKVGGDMQALDWTGVLCVFSE